MTLKKKTEKKTKNRSNSSNGHISLLKLGGQVVRERGGGKETEIFQTNLKRSTSALESIKHRLENASSSSLARVGKIKKFKM